ncbi:MAG: hypothetical protein ONB12_00915 [candidate division KSB1 bacterium]|nr:hypothetical protein [candidate division KSB1 bacterium]
MTKNMDKKSRVEFAGIAGVLGLTFLVLLWVSCGKKHEAQKPNQPLTLRSVAGYKSSPLKIQFSYYSALYWHGLRRLGLWNSTLDPKMETWYRQLSPLLMECGSTKALFNQPLQKFLYHMPAYLDPENPEELHRQFKVIQEFVGTGSLDVFTRNYPETKNWQRWYCEPSLRLLKSAYAGREEVVIRIIDIWDAYMRELWPRYREEYKKKISSLDTNDYRKEFEALRIFDYWQKAFETTYPYNEFVVMLCPETPALAARIGPEKVILGAQQDRLSLYNGFVQEVGMRYFEPAKLAEDKNLKPLLQSDYTNVMKLIEAEVCRLKMEKLPDLKDDPYVTAFQIQKLINLRPQVFFDTTFVGAIPKLYQTAKERSCF